VAVVHALILDHDHVHVLVVKVQEDIQSQPVGQGHRCEFFKNDMGKIDEINNNHIICLHYHND